MMRSYLPKDKQELVKWYERYISPISLVAGFLADNWILLRRVDLWTSNALLFFYLIVAAAGILILNAVRAGKVKNDFILHNAPLIPIFVQFSFGGLFSGYLSLYSRSAGIFQSWVFVLALAALLIGNERFTRLYTRFSFQVSLYFTVLFSFYTFFLPVIFREIGPVMFLISGCASLATIVALLAAIAWVSPDTERAERPKIMKTIASIYIVFNILYFSNVIPPLPLSIKEAGVYHHVARTNSGTYELVHEPVTWYESLLYTDTFHKVGDENVYVFTAIFAPSGLTTPILHEWQKFDDGTRRWVTANTVTFSIVGGRDGGYRGYSQKYGISEGAWRVNVLTQYGATIGRVTFNVVQATSSSKLIRSEE